MSSKSIFNVFQWGIVTLCIATFLLADEMVNQFSGFMASVFREVGTICRNDSLQWMLVVCLAVYFVFFCFLERQRDSTAQKGNVWLLAFTALCLAGYMWNYSAAVKSLQVLVLVAGMVFGKGMVAWVKFRHHIRPADTFSPVEAEKDSIRKMRGIIFILLALLSSLALWQPETSPTFFYHGIHRWCGVWDNPNLYGLLMGVGVILGIGMGSAEWRLAAGRKWVYSLLCFVATAVCGYGLFKSYSRGGWVGTAVGLIYLIGVGDWRLASRDRPWSIFYLLFFSSYAWFRKNQRSLEVILISIVVIGFWQLRFLDSLPAQRLASMGNPNDFSWRNRITAWQGAWSMMLDRPLTGFGWGEAETAYAKKYCPTTESAAIEMNDFLMIGISSGVPAMVCFFIYVFLGLRKKSETGWTRCSTLNEPSSIFHVPSSIRVAAVVLLVGFWFDGGLFKLPVAVVFWTLLELSRLKSYTAQTVDSLSTGKNSNPVVKTSARGIWMIVLAAVLALAAMGLTAIHFVTPRLAVSERTLELARIFLVYPKERNSFELLAAQPIWRGVKLKTLLDHADLAIYNRALVNWQVEEKMFQDFVLSPVITGDPNEQFDWRRHFWEEFYPRIRHESSPENAAKIIIKQLRERDTPADDFERLSVAALRSVGIPARLNANHRAEYFDNSKWHAVSMFSFSDFAKMTLVLNQQIPPKFRDFDNLVVDDHFPMKRSLLLQYQFSLRNTRMSDFSPFYRLESNRRLIL